MLFPIFPSVLIIVYRFHGKYQKQLRRAGGSEGRPKLCIVAFPDLDCFVKAEADKKTEYSKKREGMAGSKRKEEKGEV